MSEIAKLTDRAMEKAQEAKNPVGAYLAALGGPASRRTQLTALRAAISALRGIETSDVSAAEVWDLDWWTLGVFDRPCIM